MKTFTSMGRSGLAVTAAVLLSTSALAGDIGSAESIVKSLEAPKAAKTRGVKTRSLSGGTAQKPSAKAKLRSILAKVRAPGFVPQVSTTQQDRVKIQETVAAHALPTLDVEIYFDTGSADIRARSMPDLNKLGLALRDPRLKGSDFMIIGHTDARGDDAYNLRLSKARAQSVRRFLVETFRLDGENLLAIGYGEEQLKRPDQPAAAENRRVQFVNLAQ
ncbi:MAG: OmpA family protein [Pseudomonadota bacterium]